MRLTFDTKSIKVKQVQVTYAQPVCSHAGLHGLSMLADRPIYVSDL